MQHNIAIFGQPVREFMCPIVAALCGVWVGFGRAAKRAEESERMLDICHFVPS
jgi:hypothetical protein